MQFVKKNLLLVLIFSCSSFFSCEVLKARDDQPSYLAFPDYYAHQSMVVFNDNIFFITLKNGDLICDIYDIKTSSPYTKVSLPFDGYNVPHANVSSFGSLMASSTSISPCLYVSQWDYERLALVYDVYKENGSIKSSLIQVIDPSRLNKEIIGYGNLDWVVDNKNGYLFAVAYERENSALESEDNSIHITKFSLPDIYGTYYVSLCDSDILSSFVLPIMNATQDKCFLNGYLYIASGYSDPQKFCPNKLYRVNPETHEVLSTNIRIEGEPEGLTSYNGRLLLNMDNASGFVFYLEYYLENTL